MLNSSVNETIDKIYLIVCTLASCIFPPPIAFMKTKNKNANSKYEIPFSIEHGITESGGSGGTCIL